jgi:endonuclease/exonuclease/phosphatase family metal-dependent hydrolase
MTKFLGLLFIFASSFANALPVSLVQFNTWGVPFVVKDTYRYRESMKAIEKLNPDFVVLQEVFSGKGKRAFHSALYPFEVRGPRAFPKLTSSGLRMLSRYPVLRSAQTVFKHCQGDDCLSRKGAVIMVVQLPDGQKLNVLGTHLNARGGDPLRQKQLQQIKLLVDTYAEPAAPLIVSGDFNFGPNSDSYQYLIQSLNARDAWTDTHSASELGITYDAFDNRYAHDYAVQTHSELFKDRIDLIVSKNGLRSTIRTTDSQLIFNDAPLYSDHYGIWAKFEIGKY